MSNKKSEDQRNGVTQPDSARHPLTQSWQQYKQVAQNISGDPSKLNQIQRFEQQINSKIDEQFNAACPSKPSSTLAFLGFLLSFLIVAGLGILILLLAKGSFWWLFLILPVGLIIGLFIRYKISNHVIKKSKFKTFSDYFLTAFSVLQAEIKTSSDQNKKRHIAERMNHTLRFAWILPSKQTKTLRNQYVNFLNSNQGIHSNGLSWAIFNNMNKTSTSPRELQKFFIGSILPITQVVGSDSKPSKNSIALALQESILSFKSAQNIVVPKQPKVSLKEEEVQVETALSELKRIIKKREDYPIELKPVLGEHDVQIKNQLQASPDQIHPDIRKTLDPVIERLNDMDKYTIAVDSGFIRVYSPNIRKPECAMQIMVQVDLEGVPPDLVFKMIDDPECRAKWNKKQFGYELVETDIPNISFKYSKIKTPPFVTNRDFLFKRTMAKDYKGYRYVSFGKSEEHEKFPVTKKFVRAEFKYFGVFIKELNGDPNSTELRVINEIDLNGSIPKFIIKRASTKGPKDDYTRFRKIGREMVKEGKYV